MLDLTLTLSSRRGNSRLSSTSVLSAFAKPGQTLRKTKRLNIANPVQTTSLSSEERVRVRTSFQMQLHKFSG